MTFANPAGLWLLGLVVPVLLLHVLKPQRDSVDVSSVYLWKGLAAPVSAARPWQKLRMSWLLLLQLLVVVGLAVAVARPVRLTESVVAEHTVFIVDASGSMGARDGDPSRLDSALREARRLRDEMPAGGLASIVVANAHPDVLLTQSTDRSAFDDALGQVEVTPGTQADFAEAFSLAESLETPGADIGFVLLSDGGLSAAEQRLIPPATTYRQIGEASDNRAITALHVEPYGSGLYAVVGWQNAGGDKATQTLRVDVDGKNAYSKPLTMKGEESGEVVIPDLPAGDRVEAFLEGEDLLDADDHAYAVAQRAQRIDVTVAVPDSVRDDELQGADPILEALLKSMKGVKVTWVKGSQRAPQADLVIYDQVDPPADPGTRFWAIAPPSGAPGIEVVGNLAEPALTLIDATDPLLTGVDLTAVTFADVQQLDTSSGKKLVGDDAGNPFIVRGVAGQDDYIYFAFPFQHSTIWKDPAFPVLGSRIVTELAGAALPPDVIEVGDPLPVFGEKTTKITAPGGTVTEVPAGAPVPRANRVGFWKLAAEDEPTVTLAVNAASGEADIKPAPSLLAEQRKLRDGEALPRGQKSILAWVVLPLLAIALAEWLLVRRRAGVGRGQFRVAAALRLLVVLGLIGALLNLAWVRPSNRVATMFVVDASDSLGPTGREAALDWVRQAIADMPDDAIAGVALVGADARLELTMQSDPVLGPATVQLDPTRTNLADGLRKAKAVLPTDARRRVVLVSDGRPTDDDVEAEAAELREAGVPVDVHLVERPSGADASIGDLDVPNRVRLGEQVHITATVVADRAGPATVALLSDGKTLDQQTVQLKAGDGNRVTFTVPASTPGVARFQVKVTFAGDGVRENDIGYGAVFVEGPPKVLVLEGHPGAGGPLVEALRASKMQLDVKPATELPPLDVLGTEYRSIVLADVPADLLTADQTAALTSAVRDLGRGLVTVGGTQSYGPGNYLGSDLEKLLPVVSDILDPKRRQTVSQVLAVDTSGSMDACHCAEGSSGRQRDSGGVKKTDIARAGAARAIDALSNSDSVGILGVDTEDRWLMDLQQAPAEDVVTSGLRKLTPTGSSTDLSTALSTAAEQLRKSKTNLKHIILFTDGFVSDPGIFENMADQAAALREEGITVSVMATGEGAAEELQAIADAGGGRFYAGKDLHEIPQLMQEETVMASRDFINEGRFVPVVKSNAETVRDLVSTPELLGYVATTTKDQASTDLAIGSEQDPLLASWNVGLGRVASWTSDAGQRWGQQWVGWEGFVDFWSGVVGSTFPPATASRVNASIEDGALKVELQGEPGGTFPPGAEASAKVTYPDGTVHDVRLGRENANRFSATVDDISQPGTYAVAAAMSGGGSSGAVGGTALANLSYSPEYLPGKADGALLRRVSQRSEGRGEITPEQAFDKDKLHAGHHRVELARWLLLLAALLWPVAVALSRLVLRGSVAGRVRYAGASAAWYLKVARTRLPGLPARKAEAPSPPPRPAPPAPVATEREKVEAAAPSATLGSLLESQRQRRDGQDPRK